MDIDPEKFTADDADRMSRNYQEGAYNRNKAQYIEIIKDIQKVANESESRQLRIKNMHPSVMKKLQEVGFTVRSTATEDTYLIMW